MWLNKTNFTTLILEGELTDTKQKYKKLGIIWTTPFLCISPSKFPVSVDVFASFPQRFHFLCFQQFERNDNTQVVMAQVLSR